MKTSCNRQNTDPILFLKFHVGIQKYFNSLRICVKRNGFIVCLFKPWWHGTIVAKYVRCIGSINTMFTCFRFIKGFKYRNEPECDENRDFVKFTKMNYLQRLAQCAPRTVLDKSWLPAPKLLQEVGVLSTDSIMHNCLEFSSGMSWTFHYCFL